MADGDDDDRDRPGTSESDASALESWGDIDGGIGRGRATRSWSQLAALDEDGQPTASADGDKPVEGLLTVDSGMLDMMELEAGAADEAEPSTPAEHALEGAPDPAATGPDDFDADLAAALPDDIDFDDDGALPDDVDFDDGGALPDDIDFDAVGDSGALPDDIDFDAVTDGGALPDGQDFETLLGGGMDDVALPMDFDLDDDLAIGGALPEAVPLDAFADDPDAGPAYERPEDTASESALPDDFDLPDAAADPLADLAGLEDAALPDDLDAALPDDLDAALPDDLEAALPDDLDGVLPDDFDAALPDDLDAALPDDLAGALPADLDAVLDDDLDAALPDDFDFDGVIGAEDDLDASLATTPGEMVPEGLEAELDLDDLAPDAAALDGALPLDMPADPLLDDALLGEADLDPDDLAIGLADELDDLGVDPDLAIGIDGDGDWLDGVLDQMDGPVDEGWGELLDDAEPVAMEVVEAPIASDQAMQVVEVEEAVDDLWAEADWGEEPETPAAPAAMPFEDPFAMPVAGGLEDETGFLGDPFAQINDQEGRRRTGILPTLKPTGPLGPTPAAERTIEGAEPFEVEPEDIVDEAPRPPTEDELLAARALLAARSSARRRERVFDADDPEVMVVEELLEEGDDRRVVRLEYPRLGEMEILELPEDGALLPGLDEDLDAPFAESFVFFDDDPLPALSDEGQRRSALAALSREPVELARLLARPADAPTPPAEDEADEAPLVRPTDGSASAEIEQALDALAIEPLGDPVLPLPMDPSAARPSWMEAAAAFDAEALAELGLPFLGIVPPFGARSADRFPAGSLAHRRVTDEGGRRAIVPALPVPESGPETHDWARRLVGFLATEARAEPDRRRLAVLLHGIGVVARSPLARHDLAFEAQQAAVDNDPGLALARWSLQALMAETDRHDEAIARLTREGEQGVSAADLHWAGHIARSHLRDDEQALARWASASRPDAPHAPSLLARYLVHAGRRVPAGVAGSLDALLDAAEGPVWWTALALERVRLGPIAGTEPRKLVALLEEAIRRRGGVPAVFAAVERHALRHGQMSLWLSALRARFDRVMADYEGGAVDEGVAQREVAEVFVKAGLALETLGRRTEALVEYENALGAFPDDPYVLHRAVELARRLGDHDALRRHLDRLARLSPSAAERAEAAYQMGLLAQRVLADDAAAEQDYQRALAAMPTFTPALAALGRLDLRRGRIEAIQDRYADEIRQREDALRQPQTAADRRRTIAELVDRYYRLARLLEETGDAPVALDVYKRALAVEPTFLPAFEAMDRLYTRHGRWRERAALILGWVQRQKAAPLEAVGPLLTAADTLRVYLDDAPNAARLAARTLALAPDHPYALRRASESFARVDNTAARIEVDLRWGRQETDPRAPGRLLRAAQLQELDGDSLAAAAEALPLYREALGRDPESIAAIDGLVRTAVRLGRTGELVQQIELHDLAAQPAPIVALPIADALLAAGRPDEAAEFLIRWRARARSAGTLDRRADVASLSLLALACERVDHWRALVDALEELAGLHQGGRRAALLARVGALWELRLAEPSLAADAYRRALAADADCRPAAAGVERLSVAERGDWRPTGAEAEALDRARQADRAGDHSGRASALDDLAAQATDPRQAVAWRVLARGEDTSAEAAGALFAAHPERADLFASYRRRLEAAGDTPALIEALWLRLDYEDEAGRTAILTSIIGHAMRIGEQTIAHEAIDSLLEMDPDSLPALLARRRLARVAGDGRAAFDAGRQLAGVLRAPRPAAELHHAEALEAEARGASPARVNALLERAVSLDPTHDPSADALAARLKARGDWQALDALYARRLGALGEAARRHPIARERATLMAERFDDTAGAFALLKRELVAENPTPETALQAARYAEQLGRADDADRCFGAAAEAEDGRMRIEATLAFAGALHRRGDGKTARALLEQIVQAHPRHIEALELLAEVLASQRAWKQVVQTFRKLMALETAPVARADRAMAIAEIFARVYHDPRRAAGWFKRAVDFDPDRLRAVWRLLEEADKAEDGVVPIEPIRDAVDKAIEARRRALVQRPTDRETLDALARLHARRRDRDAQLVVGEALDWLGLADARTRQWIAAARARVSVDFARPLSDELRASLLDDPGEHGRARTLFDAFALVLTEVLAGSLPGGVPRLSRRSFPEWQAELRRLAAGLGVDDVELFNGGRRLTAPRAVYLPRPSIAVPGADLEAPLDAAQAFALGRLLDGLRGGRMLLTSPGVERVEICASVMASVLCPGLLPTVPAGAVPESLRHRLVERAKRLPRRLKLQLDGLAASAGGPVRLGGLAKAVAATRDRAGLICCGDVRVALDGLVFADPAAADAARRTGGMAAALDASPAGRALMAYALGADHARLRRVLGLGLSGRVG